MKLVQLLDLANMGYPDHFLREYYNRKTGKRKPASGDTLAEFIVIELSETFNSKASKDVQLSLAMGVLENAKEDLQKTIDAIECQRR